MDLRNDHTTANSARAWAMPMRSSFGFAAAMAVSLLIGVIVMLSSPHEGNQARWGEALAQVGALGVVAYQQAGILVQIVIGGALTLVLAEHRVITDDGRMVRTFGRVESLSLSPGHVSRIGSLVAAMLLVLLSAEVIAVLPIGGGGLSIQELIVSALQMVIAIALSLVLGSWLDPWDVRLRRAEELAEKARARQLVVLASRTVLINYLRVFESRPKRRPARYWRSAKMLARLLVLPPFLVALFAGLSWGIGAGQASLGVLAAAGIVFQFVTIVPGKIHFESAGSKVERIVAGAILGIEVLLVAGVLFLASVGSLQRQLGEGAANPTVLVGLVATLSFPVVMVLLDLPHRSVRSESVKMQAGRILGRPQLVLMVAQKVGGRYRSSLLWPARAAKVVAAVWVGDAVIDLDQRCAELKALFSDRAPERRADGTGLSGEPSPQPL